MIQRAIQTVEGVGPQSGVDFKTAARLLGREDGIFKATDPNIDVEEKLYAAKLDVLNSRQLLNNNEAQDIADATIYKMRVYQRAQIEAMERIAQMEKNEQQLNALTQQQGIEYTSESQASQKYIFMKYELYKRKWKALNRSWNELHKIDAVSAQSDGKRPPLETWSQTTGQESSNSSLSAPVRVIKVAFALRAFDFVTRRMGLSSTTGVMSALRNRIFITTQTLADTWNMGVLKSFSEWATTDDEANNPDVYNEKWYAKWLETSRDLNRSVLEKVMAERARQRELTLEESREAQRRQRDDERKGDGDEVENYDDRVPVGAVRPRTNDDDDDDDDHDDMNLDDDDEQNIDQGGGRRKKKTRKRKRKTKRRKKMKGGNKSKNKRKKKKSKTRRKRGGRDCKKILKDEKVCDKKGWIKASRRLHPDKGGDGNKFRNMNECYQENKANLSCSKKENSPQVEEEASPKKIDKNERKSAPLSKINTEFTIKNSKVLTKEDTSLPRIKNILGI